MSFKNEPRTEWALLYPMVKDGPLDRVMPCESLDHAAETQVAWSGRGVETRVLRRTITAWADHG